MRPFPIDEMLPALDLWLSRWTVEERAAFERALVRVIARSNDQRLRLLAWAAARAIGTPVLRTAADEEERWLGLEREELASAQQAIEPFRRAFLAARALSASLNVLLGALRRAALKRSNEDELLALDLVDARRLLEVLEGGYELLVREQAGLLLGRRGPHQRARLGVERARPDDGVHQPISRAA